MYLTNRQLDDLWDEIRETNRQRRRHRRQHNRMRPRSRVDLYQQIAGTWRHSARLNEQRVEILTEDLAAAKERIQELEATLLRVTGGEDPYRA